jgi:streptogramin lyase
VKSRARGSGDAAEGQGVQPLWYYETIPTESQLSKPSRSALWLRRCVVAALFSLAFRSLLVAQVITEFPLPPGTFPLGITAGPDGALWFTAPGRTAIGRITASGSITFFPLPSKNEPTFITSGPDGNLWFTELPSSIIGRITPQGAITEFTILPLDQPHGVAEGPDGALWFGDIRNNVGRISTSGVITLYPVPFPGQPDQIVAGPDGALWFTEPFRGNIGRITTGGQVNMFPATDQVSTLAGIASGPDGALWFTEQYGSRIGRISVSGEVKKFDLPFSGPAGIAPGPDGNLWFVANGSPSYVGRMSPAGTLTQYFLGDQTVSNITVGPDGAMWFTELFADRIGRISVPLAVAALSPAKLWLGLKNGDDVGLRLDLRAEILINSTKVGQGELNNVASGSSGFNGAILNTIPLSLTGGEVTVVPGGSLSIQVSARRTCFGGGHTSGTARLWYSGKAVDSGASRDAGSRFDATIGNTTNDYFLRTGLALSTTPGSSRTFADVLLNSAALCPSRPFTSLGTWTTTFP